MENIQKNLSKSLFHTQILESELKQLDLSAQKTVLQTWVSSLDELTKKTRHPESPPFLPGYWKNCSVTMHPETPLPFSLMLVLIIFSICFWASSGLQSESGGGPETGTGVQYIPGNRKDF